MPSFRDVSAYSPALVIDAASSLVQAGLFHATGTAQWESSTDESGVAIFQCLERLHVDPQAVAAFVFCEGPGSILGIRSTAMALRIWCALKPRPVFAYCSLAVVAHASGRTDLGVVADARRDSWHHFRIGHGLHRVPENFRHWSTLPAGVGSVPYSLANLIPQVAEVDLLRATDAPDAFLHEEPSYATWSPQIHRAPQP
jgi:tRNA threonylcarbamoyladenosine biosynthesis protein TsaB